MTELIIIIGMIALLIVSLIDPAKSAKKAANIQREAQNNAIAYTLAKQGQQS